MEEDLNDVSNVETSESIDFSSIIEKIDYQNEKIDYQNDLIVIGDIFLVAILVFLAFKNALKGLWK